MKKKNNVLHFILYIVAGAIIGVIFRKIGIRVEDFKHALIGMLIFIATFFLSVLFHELSHAIAFIFNGLKIRMIQVSVFCIIKTNGKYRMRFNLNSVTGLGGIVIPEVSVIKDQKEYNALKSAYSKSLISAPIVTLLLAVAGLVLGIISIFLKHDFNTYLKISFWCFAAINILLTFSSCINTNTVIGDFPAYSLCRKDSFFLAVQLWQYRCFNENYLDIRYEKDYVYDLIVNDINIERMDFITVSIIDSLLVSYLINRNIEMASTVKEYIDNIIKDSVRLETIIEENDLNEPYYVLAFHIVFYLYDIDKERGRELFDRLIRIVPDNTVIHYLIKQCEHKYAIADNSAFLSKKSNINPSSTISLFQCFKIIYDDEETLNGILIK